MRVKLVMSMIVHGLSDIYGEKLDDQNMMTIIRKDAILSMLVNIDQTTFKLGKGQHDS